MVSSSDWFFVLLVAFLLQCLVVSASALTSTKYIDQLCQMESIKDRAFCLQTLRTYPPAVSATALFPLAEVVLLGVGVPYANLLMQSADRAAEKVPALKEQFKQCQDSYVSIVMNLKAAASELKLSPISANYDTMVCFDQTTRVYNLIGKNKDSTSKSLMEMTMHMEKLIHLAVGATEVVGGRKHKR
ncbi:hypothetical protein CARUB_v10022057mg [Capsella rubella]|uniref:Pectinesterase inhibitor domain-containing protein n=1 Tax=Capsella rubella TaxID=81985 RepID=R0HXI9_9BRAS|nr:uncharacterized protein LOC17894891 [Capsella rubella]EOA34514.1 hypothetical protein CARUB_v10022057mg [Capsella rubella]